MSAEYECRNCGGLVTVPYWAQSSSHLFVHVEPSSGLLGSEYCYPSPRADPVMP